MLKPTEDSHGYLQIGLTKHGKQTRYLAHRLLLITFKGLCESKPFVNHINGIKSDNRIDNLEWCTRSENHKHAFSLGLMCNKGENHPGHKLTEQQVKEIRAKYIPRKYSSRKIASEYGISKTNVLDIVNNKIW